MLKTLLVFVACLSTVYSLTLVYSELNALVLSVGWIVVVVYSANIITRWILSVAPKEMVNPDGKAVLITGCDTGFGLSLAHKLHSYGFYVYACCLSEESEGALELSKLPERIKVLSLDVTKYDQVQNVMKQVEADLGYRDLWSVVNNAGVAIFSELEWCSMSIIEHMFHVNVLGTVRVTKAFLPLLRKCQGRVVIVTSVAGHITYPGFLSYSMTKHALVSLADGLRREMLKWNIGVVSIEPTMYKTRITHSDVLTGALDNSWERTPDAIKEAYGFPYYEDFKGRMQKMVKQARPYLEEVVCCMEQAVTVVQPQLCYRCSGFLDKVRFQIMSILPTQLLDMLICYVIQPNHRQLSGGSGSGKSS